jgi:SP family galactose:H+ symporter-like MFS transporter
MVRIRGGVTPPRDGGNPFSTAAWSGDTASIHNGVIAMAQAQHTVYGRTRPHHWGYGPANVGAPLPTATKQNGYIYVIAILGALNGLLFGYDTGVISGALLFIKTQFGISPFVQEVVTSGVLVGAVIGAAVSGRISDIIGRRKMILVAAVLFILGVVGSALAPNVPTLVVTRGIVGLGIGVSSMIGPLYISEVAPARIRGGLVSLNQLAITSGILISYLVNLAFASSGDWRWMFGLGVIPAVVLGLGVIFMPESPRWLVDHGRNDEAQSVLARVDPDLSPDDIAKTVREIAGSTRQERRDLGALLAPSIRPALIIGVALAVFQQVTGINTIIYYAPTIFQIAGFQSATASIFATIGVGVVNVVMTIVAIQLVDRVGRRSLLLGGLVGMTVSLAVLGLAFALPVARSQTAAITVVGLLVYIASFAVGLGPVFWLMISEIYPVTVRGTAMSVATVANWAANLVVALTFLTLLNRLGTAPTFWLYGLFTVATWFFVQRLMPETKGRTLEQIQQFWQGHIGDAAAPHKPTTRHA